MGKLVDNHNTAGSRDNARANITTNGNVNSVKWQHWLGHQNVSDTPQSIGVTDGTEWFVPSVYTMSGTTLTGGNCIMVASWAHGDFCGVCAEELSRQMGSNTGWMLGVNAINFNVISRTSGISGFRTYTIRLENNNPFAATITYIDRQVNESIARNFSSNNTVTITIPANGSQNVSISESIGTSYIAANIVFVTGPTRFRMISYANELPAALAGNGRLDRRFNVQNQGVGFKANNLTATTAEISEATATLIGEIYIPNRINGRAVTSIGSSVFSGQTQMTTVHLPTTLQTLGNSAFSGCSNLANINFGTSPVLQTIGSFAFANLTQLTQISIPNSVTSIGSNAFKNCTGLTNVTLSNSLTTIDSYAFKGCSSLSSIIIPSSVTSIGYEAFRNCSNLTIYITGMTSVPNGWNNYWNPSNRPIYFNGTLHTHNNDGREFTGNHYHGIKKNHHYEYRYYCTQCKFTFGIDYEIEICSGPPCPTLYNLPYLSDIDHFEGDSHHDDLQNSLHNQIVKYLPTKKKIY